MGMVQSSIRPTSLHRNFVSRCLKSEIQSLQGLLKILEQSEWPGENYIVKFLRVTDVNFKDLIRYLSN